uniref:Uncharacterized protein n=1 Tax=Anopheles atroparvus TaxID=41427 RepID=A0AAG5CS04_ANOAO
MGRMETSVRFGSAIKGALVAAHIRAESAFGLRRMTGPRLDENKLLRPPGRKLNAVTIDVSLSF